MAVYWYHKESYVFSELSPFKRSLFLFWIFFRIGAFTIGGGYAMLPIIEKEFVSKRRWVTEEDMVDIIAIVQSLPGVIAFNTSMFIGYKVAGFFGAVIAALGMMLPSLIIISLFSLVYVSVQDNAIVQAAFLGIRAGVTALIGIAGFKLSRRVLDSAVNAAIAAVSFAAVWYFSFSAAYTILIAALLGLVMYGIVKVRAYGID
jgi:chromate transporter